MAFWPLTSIFSVERDLKIVIATTTCNKEIEPEFSHSINDIYSYFLKIVILLLCSN